MQDAGLIRDLAPSAANPPTFVIDAGWYSNNCNLGGPYNKGNQEFPDMPGLASRLRESEIRPGIWIRPLLTTEPVPLNWRVGANHPHAATASNTLDPSVDEVLAHVSADLRRLHDWGYEVIKHDFSTFDIIGRWGFAFGADITAAGWSFADRTRTTAEIIRGLYSVIRDAAGDSIVIGCNTIGHLGAGLFELQRTGDDTSGRYWERTRRMGVNTLAFRMPQHGAFFHADADCVGLTRNIPWEQNRHWLDLVSRSGTPLFVSADPDAIGSEQRTALRKAFQRSAHNSVRAEPLDWLRTTCPRHWRFGGETSSYDWATSPETAFECPL
jgi:alpha-galactosidase